MRTDKKMRLLLTEKRSAEENCAIDEVLTKLYKEDQMPILRLYSWEKSFSVGMSQRVENYSHLLTFSESFAKRITGGGVLFHGNDISYSLIIPTHFWGALNVKETYEKICSFVIRFYNRLGPSANFAKENEDFSLEKSDYCQKGTELYDITIDGVKIGGNAQRRTKDFIFQHGSIPLEAFSAQKDTFDIGTSLEELGVEITFENAQKELIRAFEECFDIQLVQSELTTRELEMLSQKIKENA